MPLLYLKVPWYVIIDVMYFPICSQAKKRNDFGKFLSNVQNIRQINVTFYF